MNTIRWRALPAIALTAIAVLAAGCGDSESDGAGSAAKSGQSLSIGLQADYSAFPVFVAQDQGYMKKHGVSEVEIVKFTSLPAMTTAVSRGQVDMGLHTPLLVATANAASSGELLKLFAPIQRGQIAWSARNEAGIPVATPDTWETTVKAWRGKKIGAAPGGLIEAMTKSMGKSVGLTAGEDFEIVDVGVGPQQAAALKAGVADAASGDAFGAVQIAQSGVGETIIDFLEQNVPPAFRGEIMTAGFFAPEPTLNEKRELYAGFAAALDDARAFIKDPANRAEVEQSLITNIKVSPELAKGLYDKMAGFDIDMSKDTVDRTVKVFVDTGLFKAPGPSYADLVTDVGKG